ncbi:MAG: beta-ketoacyl-[acyl-carrier-protein] synthase family protein [Bacteroidetes bacterium]|nr:beta-ketoacyl-[acyl-carrier-protein] synthase family protein [Bacteroidota bacterium]
MSDPICVTGLGIISAIGNNCRENVTALLNEQTGIAAMRYLNSIHTEFPVGEVALSDNEMKQILNINSEKIIARTTLLGIFAVQEACEQSQIFSAGYKRIGFISGTTVGGMEKSESFYLDFLENNSKNEYIGIHDCGACTEGIADYFGKFSMTTTISTACSSAANAIILGANMLKTGMLDAVIVGGAECLTKFHLNGFNTLMILDKEHCRPFDAHRAGINLGEGAGYLVLEKEKNALSRNAKPICTVSGYGNACDAYHQTASSPDGKGALLAMQKAIEMSGLDYSDIDYINAHGTGTNNNDLSEGTAVSTLFDKIPPISSTKSFTGHTTSAAGGVESVLSILAMKHRFLPANLNFNTHIPELNLIPVQHTVRDVQLNHILKNSFGFGGNNSSIIFSNYTTE